MPHPAHDLANHADDGALLACVGPGMDGDSVVRRACQLAVQAKVAWFAAYVETPQLQRLAAAERQRILETLALAQRLGATTAVLAGSDIAAMLTEYARSQGAVRLVLGRRAARWRMPWRRPLADAIAACAAQFELVEVATGAMPSTLAYKDRPSLLVGSRRYRYLIAIGASLATAVLTMPLWPHFDLANIAMLFLLTVVLVAVRFGREASVVATVVGAAALMMAAPRIRLGASDLQYAVTLLVMLTVGLITGNLTAGLRYQASVARHREQRSRALYEFARALSGTLLTQQVFDITREYIERTFGAQTIALLPDNAGRLQYPPTTGRNGVPALSVLDLGTAQWAFDHASPAGLGTSILPASSFFYLPLVAPMRTRGVLAIWPGRGAAVLVPEQRKQLDTFGALAAIALERVHYVDVAHDTQVKMESERLRNALLAALSHDLRTPLTALVGLSESLTLSRPALSNDQMEVAGALRDEARRMSTLVSNLLDMARMQSGAVALNLQWHTLEETVGTALRASHWQLTDRIVQTRLAAGLPLVRYDAVLVERVLCNLLENAAKYTPPGSHILVEAGEDNGQLVVTVHDDGPGLPPGREEAIFEKFTRGERESSIPGVGLGLAICRAIVHAHDGSIGAAQSKLGGAAIAFRLAIGTPPAPPMADELQHTANT